MIITTLIVNVFTEITDNVDPSVLQIRRDNRDNLGIISRALVAQWVKGWPTDLADQVQSLLEAKSSQP